jgi:PTS system nitrogen regulatory IIA component
MHLTISQVSKLLNLPVSTVQRWIRQGNIPVYRHEGKYLFLEKDLVKWAQSQGIVITSKSQKAPARKPVQECSLVQAMRRGGIVRGVSGDDASGVLKAVVGVAPLAPSIDRNELFVRLIEREDLSTTGIGRGVAIPHPRSPVPNVPSEPSITTCFLDQPTDYGAIDHIPVFVLFLMLSPSPKIHLRLLARLSYLLRENSFIEFLRGTPSAEDVILRVEEIETKMDQAHRSSGLSNAF